MKQTKETTLTIRRFFSGAILMIFMLGLGITTPITTVAETVDATPAPNMVARTLVGASSNNFPPINILDDGGELTGFGRELSDAVIEAVGGEITHIHSGIWGDVLKWLDEGKADFIHDTGYAPDRTSFLDYSDPIIEMPEEIYVRADQFDILDFDGLAGKKVACVNKHITHIYLQKFPNINCHIVKTPKDGLSALINGDADAFIYPRQIALYLAQNVGVSNDIKKVGDPLRTLTWSMTVKKGNADMLRILNAGIAKVKASGRYDEIYNKWFGYAVTGGFSIEEVRRFSIIAGVLSLLTGGLLMMAVSNKRLRRAHRQVLAESEERRRAEEGARALSAELDRFFTLSFDMLCIADFQGYFRRLNPAWGVTLGYGINELTARPFIEFVHPDDMDGTIEAANKLSEGNKVVEFENRYRTKSGEYVWLLWNAISDTKTGMIYATASDITTRKQYQETLEREVRNRTRDIEMILNAAGDGIYGVDLNGLCTFVNPAAANMLRWDVEELVGQNNHDLFHHTRADGTPYPRTECPIYAAFRDGQVQSVTDEVFWRKDGTSFSVEYTSTPIYEGGKVTGAVVVFRDVSKQILMQEQLIQSSKLATLGEMATGVAHEISQPLNIIRLSVANIQKRINNGDIDMSFINGKMDKVVRQIERAASIIDHMRNFGRNTPEESTAFNPEAVIRNSLDMIGEQLRLSNIEVINDFAVGDCEALGHEVRVEQVMLNLLSNARDAINANSKKGGAITLRTRMSPEQSSVLIEVEDTGGGIPEDVLLRIFEPFFTTKEVGEGTGLGLSISYGIVRDMGGELKVMNGDEGALFTIEFPAVKREQAA